MLLEFRAKNYRSFKDEFVFSLIPDTGKKIWNTVFCRKISTVKNIKLYVLLLSMVLMQPVNLILLKQWTL